MVPPFLAPASSTFNVNFQCRDDFCSVHHRDLFYVQVNEGTEMVNVGTEMLRASYAKKSVPQLHNEFFANLSFCIEPSDSQR